jgi:hypothetical protein
MLDWTARLGRTPILVPRRPDNGRRDAIWQNLRDRVWSKSNVVEGEHLDGPFNRAAALNRAADAAGDWDVAIIADSDSLVTPETLLHAVGLALNGHAVIAHSQWVNVETDETESFLDTGKLEIREDRAVWMMTVSSMLAIPRSVWDAVNGFDEHFAGWGEEDRAFMRAVETLTGPAERLEGAVYHLAHDRPTEDTNRGDSPEFMANWQRSQTYRDRTPEDIRAIVAGNRVTEYA